MKRRTPTTLNDELRRLQKTMALLICVQAAAAEGADADMSDALAIVVKLLEESLDGLDKLEVTIDAG